MATFDEWLTVDPVQGGGASNVSVHSLTNYGRNTRSVVLETSLDDAPDIKAITTVTQEGTDEYFARNYYCAMPFPPKSFVTSENTIPSSGIAYIAFDSNAKYILLNTANCTIGEIKHIYILKMYDETVEDSSIYADKEVELNSLNFEVPDDLGAVGRYYFVLEVELSVNPTASERILKVSFVGKNQQGDTATFEFTQSPSTLTATKSISFTNSGGEDNLSIEVGDGTNWTINKKE